MPQDYQIIDTDIHNVTDGQRIQELLPEPHRTRYAAGSRGPGHLGYWNPNGVMRSDTQLPDGTKVENSPQTLAEHYFDRFKIEFGILNPGYGLHMGLSPDSDYAAAITSAGNQIIEDDWLPNDERFLGSISISAGDPDLAAEEIHRRAENPRFAQVLMASASPMPYGKKFYHPIYKAATEHDLPVAIHPGSEGVGISGAPTSAGYPSTYFEWHTALTGNYQAQLISLVTEGVFNKFPNLKFVLIEGGMAWLPPLMWRIDKNWKALRISTPWLDRPPSEVIQEHVMLTTQPIEESPNSAHFHNILDMFDSPNMLMYSSDYPHWDGDTPDYVARAIPEELRPRVMSETAREFYKLSAPTAPVE